MKTRQRADNKCIKYNDNYYQHPQNDLLTLQFDVPKKLSLNVVVGSSGLAYNVSSDQIDGLVNTGSYKNQELADHALVFIIRGITKKFKQPVAYSFCQGATKQEELVKQLKNVQNTGLCVIATICNQGKANEGAIRILNSETRLYCIRNNIEYRGDFYEIDLENGNRIKIVHLFDVPHLLKCVRNNLLTKDLVYGLDGVKLTRYATAASTKYRHRSDRSAPLSTAITDDDKTVLSTLPPTPQRLGGTGRQAAPNECRPPAIGLSLALTVEQRTPK
ncbi:Uncharacterized protein FWK35_00029343, partial [Aphis craccivora]